MPKNRQFFSKIVPYYLPSMLSETDILPVLPGINLAVCVEDVFTWLKLKRV